MCNSCHGSNVVVVRRLGVNAVALKLDCGVTEGNCGFIEARWVTSGMMGGYVAFVVCGFFVAALSRKTSFSLVYHMHR